jgi:hypothetical protein
MSIGGVLLQKLISALQFAKRLAVFKSKSQYKIRTHVLMLMCRL